MYSFDITILGEGHPLSPGWQGPGRYFNPPSPCGEGLLGIVDIGFFAYFNPPSPCGEGRRRRISWTPWRTYFNPPSPCGEGLVRFWIRYQSRSISIHPPRVGRDAGGEGNAGAGNGISIHPPRVGRDGDMRRVRGQHVHISIHPPRVGRDVIGHSQPQSPGLYFNPPSPCGEGQLSIRALTAPKIFQSTLPVWGGTLDVVRRDRGHCISIHPPRVGRDELSHSKIEPSKDFNPPSPCGEGHHQ